MNGTPSQALSSWDQPVTQCISALTVTDGSARSSSKLSVNGCSTSPETSRSQFAPSNDGIGP